MCASNPCLNEGTCIDMDNNTFKCLCKGGWKGLNCEGISSDVCLNFNNTLRERIVRHTSKFIFIDRDLPLFALPQLIVLLKVKNYFKIHFRERLLYPKSLQKRRSLYITWILIRMSLLAWLQRKALWRYGIQRYSCYVSYSCYIQWVHCKRNWTEFWKRNGEYRQERE